MKKYTLSVVILMLFLGCLSRQGGRFGGAFSEENAKNISYSGGNGDSAEEAIIINGVDKQSDGIAAEYQYVSSIHGEKGKMWSVVAQSIVREKTKVYDVVEIRLNNPNNDMRIYYFDVTSFPWKKH